MYCPFPLLACSNNTLFYILTVAARPNGDVVAQTLANITIVINDVPEPPEFIGDPTVTVMENQTTGASQPFYFVQSASMCCVQGGASHTPTPPDDSRVCIVVASKGSECGGMIPVSMPCGACACQASCRTTVHPTPRMPCCRGPLGTTTLASTPPAAACMCSSGRYWTTTSPASWTLTCRWAPGAVWFGGPWAARLLVGQ